MAIVEDLDCVLRKLQNDAYDSAAKIVEAAQIFHCWGDSDIDGLDVQKRLADAIRTLKEEQK